MKITSQHFSPEVKKPQETEEKAVKVTAESPAAEKAASNAVKTDASRQRMLSWFARVGISPSMMSPDPKKQKHALERRKQILETQKASNLQAVLNIALNVTINEQTSDNLDLLIPTGFLHLVPWPRKFIAHLCRNYGERFLPLR